MLSESLRSYLRAIYFVTHTHNRVRVKDIASFLHVRSASVTEALTILVEKGYTTHQPYKDIRLTKKGYQTMQEILHRQRALFDFLNGALAINTEDAQKLVSRVGDILSDEAVAKLNAVVRLLQKEQTLKLTETSELSRMHSPPCDVHANCAMCRYYIKQIQHHNAL